MNRKYTEEYRQAACRLVTKEGYSRHGAARQPRPTPRPWPLKSASFRRRSVAWRWRRRF